MNNEGRNETETVRHISNFADDVAGIKNLIDQAVKSLIEKKPEQALLAHQAEWHIKGLVYHFERLLKVHDIVASEVGSRALGIETDVIVMYSPDMQDLIFEFYALVSLARITLDELVKYVRPLFVNGPSLPKSINDFLRGQTDCPLASMLILGGEDLLRYLVDIRNCIIHYRTFATTDNTIAVSDATDESQLPDVPYFDAIRSVTRVYFRRMGGTKVSVNVLLPDKIFVESGAGKKMASPILLYAKN